MTAGAMTAAEPVTAGAVRRVQAVMGTVVSFDVRLGACGAARAHVALSRACARLERADAVFSIWKANSPMSLLRRGATTLGEAPLEMAEVLELCAVARELSGGFFDPWGVPGGLDPTGLVKGWAADKALAVLNACGIAAAMVNAGGDIATFGEPTPGATWRIGVRDPWAVDRIACVVDSPGAVATSGCYERGAHVVDPATGRPGTRCQSATVTGPELWLADALATGLLVAGEEGLGAIEAIQGYEGYVISARGSTAATRRFPFAAL